MNRIEDFERLSLVGDQNASDVNHTTPEDRQKKMEEISIKARILNGFTGFNIKKPQKIGHMEIDNVADKNSSVHAYSTEETPTLPSMHHLPRFDNGERR